MFMEKDICLYLDVSAEPFEFVWHCISCPIHSRNLIYFLHVWQSSVRFPHTSFMAKQCDQTMYNKFSKHT